MIKKDKGVHLLVIAPHRDDETLGCGEFIFDIQSQGHFVWVAFLTSGTSPEGKLNHNGHVQLRRREARRALKFLGVPSHRNIFFPLLTRNTYRKIPFLFAQLSKHVKKIEPQFILAPAFEGGHPDHDVASFLAHLLKQHHPNVVVLEYALYNWKKGARKCKEFLEKDGFITWHPSKEAKKAKARALNQYRTQQHILSLEKRTFVERFRPQPEHDYSRPPAHQKALYERWASGVRQQDVISHISAFEQQFAKKKPKKKHTKKLWHSLVFR
ncbi:MAG: PIG-L family deacetylase [Candidatus Diapherotrites archaeon]|uniref:PIG-L family deacetylase n=1 Tax=Candidatus Iainarchaeum sp. TaxID=3101447 RepID=A0A8T4L3N1_9ARCH|nr:PIG-L family deacetylase [Candidatus Diapherotrites archaeon]